MRTPGTPRYGWYGDDFTGATDTLATLARAGWRARLWLDVPSADAIAQAGPLDACGIAGAARAMAPAAMRTELDRVGRYFQQLGVDVLHYKVCSTFDSAPDVGNMAVAIHALAPHVANAFVPIVGGQPNLGRYALFGNLYARAGTDGQVHRLDRHPVMSRHPVTPMHEADLRRHLESLGLGQVGGWSYLDYRRSAEEQDGALDALIDCLREGSPELQAVLFDVATEDDLAPLGRQILRQAARQRLLAVGPSSVAQAVVAAVREMGVEFDAGLSSSARVDGGADAAFVPDQPLTPATEPVLVMAGSLSPVTALQVAHTRRYDISTLDPQRLLDDPGYGAQRRLEVCALLDAGRHVLVHTTPPDRNAPLPPLTVAEACARWLADTVHTRPLKRLGIAGGDTSSLAVRALGVDALSYRCGLGDGVAVCRVHAAGGALDGMELMLKGGQMGGEDLFERLVG